jgi:esterase/lipase superfamily enzyme
MAKEKGELQDLLRNRLAETPQKDVYIFVHGYNNAFDDAVYRVAEVWHFMGRVGVPIAYSWPAGYGGIRGYAHDRESGEFSVTHLRRFIRAVAECPDVERIHLIGHSRGCDVTISALRELHLGYVAQGKSTQRELKLENVVLAAPDVDEEVFMQRFIGENLLTAANRTTIYASSRDKVIEVADLVFASRRRLGVLGIRDFSPKMKHALARLPNVQFIECRVSGLLVTHSYVFEHPAALSDLILVLRDRRDPGAANGRPLSQPTEGIWELTDDYLKE